MEEVLSSEQLEAKLDLMARGDSAYDEGDFTLALDCYHRASVIDRHDPATWCALGMAYYNLDFNREAWRSYLLALHCDPKRPDSLWYSAEFLVGVGDMHLASTLLSTYLTVETDPERLAEARALLAETLEALKGSPLTAEQRAEVAEALNQLARTPEDAEQAAPAELDPENLPRQSAEESETENQDEDGQAGNEAAEDEEEEADEYYEVDGGFVATLSLQLSGMAGLCEHCKTSIPYDAPYCFSCLMPHFYEEV
jgi:tetratricopeptide (TPR) repeat protein